MPKILKPTQKILKRRGYLTGQLTKILEEEKNAQGKRFGDKVYYLKIKNDFQARIDELGWVLGEMG
jgi:hypothetical protein